METAICGKNLKEWLDEKNVSMQRLSDLSDVPRSTIGDIVNMRTKRITEVTAQKLLRVTQLQCFNQSNEETASGVERGSKLEETIVKCVRSLFKSASGSTTPEESADAIHFFAEQIDRLLPDNIDDREAILDYLDRKDLTFVATKLKLLVGTSDEEFERFIENTTYTPSYLRR